MTVFCLQDTKTPLFDSNAFDNFEKKEGMHKCEWSYLAKVDAATWAFKSAILVEANKRRLGHIPFSRLLINGGYLQNNLCSAIPHRVEQWRCGFGGCPRRHWRKADSTLHEINVRN